MPRANRRQSAPDRYRLHPGRQPRGFEQRGLFISRFWGEPFSRQRGLAVTRRGGNQRQFAVRAEAGVEARQQPGA